MNIRKQLAHLLIFLAGMIYPGKGPGFSYVKKLFGGWSIINRSLIRQTPCKDLKNGFQWESWALPEEYQKDFSAMSRK